MYGGGGNITAATSFPHINAIGSYPTSTGTGGSRVDTWHFNVASNNSSNTLTIVVYAVCQP